MILRDQFQLMDATMQDMSETYLALTKTVMPNISPAAARTRLSNIMLANIAAQGQAGVPANSPPITRAKTADELGVTAENAPNPYAAGTLLHEVRAAVDSAPTIQRRPQIVKARDKAGAKHSAPGRRVGYAWTEGGVSRLQARSARAAVAAFVREAAPRFVRVEEVAEHFARVPDFQGSVRQHLQKLLEAGHVRTVTIEELTPSGDQQ